VISGDLVSVPGTDLPEIERVQLGILAVTTIDVG
jgi:hypothetical protein